MKFNLYKSIAICSLMAFSGCQDFEEMNTNPYAPVYDPTVIVQPMVLTSTIHCPNLL